MTDRDQRAILVVGTHEPAATLELLGTGHIPGAAWATLTPTIRAGLQKLQFGQVLLVSIDDPLAGVDVPAWCALTGNVLQATSVEDGGVIRLFTRKAKGSDRCATKRPGETFVDIYRLPGITEEAVTEACRKVRDVEGKYDGNLMHTWFDQTAGKVFSLFESPSLQVAEQARSEAHHMVPDETLQVQETQFAYA